MGLFDHFPYTNVHELNLDWVLTMMKALEAEWDAFTAGNSLTFADPLQHDISKTYAKNTIVLDANGNAYISLQAVPVGVGLQNGDYWLMVFDYEAFIEKVNKNFTARYYRGSYRATAAMDIGDWLTVDDVLCKATAAISADDVLELGVNIEHFTLEDFIKAFMTSANQLIQQYKNDIDASELAYRQQLALDIQNTTQSLQAQLDAVIAGATVDSEVIDARVGDNGVTYSTLGVAIRYQIADQLWKFLGVIRHTDGKVSNTILNSDGTTAAEAGWTTSIFIPVKFMKYLAIDSPDNSACRLAFYDSNKTFLKYYVLDQGYTMHQLPANSVYIKISHYTSLFARVTLYSVIYNLDKSIDDMGYYTRYKSGKVLRFDIDLPIANGVPVYVRPVETSQASATKITLYGLDSSNNWVSLGDIPYGTRYTFTPTEDYSMIRVVNDPWAPGDTYYFTVDIAQPSAYSLCKLIKEFDDEFKSINKYLNRYTSSTAMCDVPIKVPLGTKIYLRPVSATPVSNYMQLYGFKPDLTYDNFGLVRLGECKEFTAAADYSYLRVVTDPYGKIPFTFDLGIADNNENLIKDMMKITSFNMFGKDSCKIFKKVVCCGDSYTSGYIDLGGGVFSNTNEEFAWPHYMATHTGNEYVNCGASGSTVLTWPSEARGLTKATAAGLTQAYILGLGLNDVISVTLGTAADIGTDSPTTYYGGLAKIVRQLNAISPDAKIFVNTMPEIGGSYDSFNQAIRDVVDAYENTYPVFLIDLVDYWPVYHNSILAGDKSLGHYTALGYEQFAEIYAKILSDYINNHISSFQDVFNISYT